MYKKLFAKMCENAVEEQFLRAKGGKPIVEHADGIESMYMSVSKYMTDTIEFIAQIDMGTNDVVSVRGYADETGAYVCNYRINGDLVQL